MKLYYTTNRSLAARIIVEVASSTCLLLPVGYDVETQYVTIDDEHSDILTVSKAVLAALYAVNSYYMEKETK